MFKKVLVPVDFTEKNIPAIKAALKMVSRNEGQVTLLHVIERVDYLAPSELKTFYETLERNALNKIEMLAKRFRKPRYLINEEIIYGKRATEIVRFAVKGQFDVIVVSSHKITAEMPQNEWGTVSYKIALLSQCPVLLVK